MTFKFSISLGKKFLIVFIGSVSLLVLLYTKKTMATITMAFYPSITNFTNDAYTSGYVEAVNVVLLNVFNSFE
ncbi:hypothetical protein [Paenibacillus castaneae]|uniref:hypothetical protein n=1 Tax=Paenibacillus castaneae TaxID=474957 RepID=UPI001ABAD307|nr:hypothetical protein [Paenibacillus castaneae]